MKISFKRTLLHRVSRVLSALIIVLFVFGLLYYSYRIFIRDSFVVNTSSMEPTIMPDSRIYVNKLIFGPRIYKNFKFEEGGQLKSFRIWGRRNIERDDIIVFNYPFDYLGTRIQFKINYVYTKRVIGLPGDTLSITNGYYRIAGVDQEFGNIEYQKILSQSQDKVSKRELQLFPNHPDYNWIISDFGPYYIPSKGDTIELTQENRIFYKIVIEYETGEKIDNISSQTYTFKENYYFVAGDNIFSSKDSRYFGVIPEDYIIGVVSRIKHRN